jgi:hypothetical protein
MKIKDSKKNKITLWNHTIIHTDQIMLVKLIGFKKVWKIPENKKKLLMISNSILLMI